MLSNLDHDVDASPPRLQLANIGRFARTNHSPHLICLDEFRTKSIEENEIERSRV